MYQPLHFREDRIEVQHALIRAHPLGLLITSGPGGLQANPIPFLVDAAASERGTLRGHLARANPQLAELAAVEECLIVFQGPQHYISSVVLRDQARDRESRADLELHHGARLGPAARDGRRDVAAPAD